MGLYLAALCYKGSDIMSPEHPEAAMSPVFLLCHGRVTCYWIIPPSLLLLLPQLALGENTSVTMIIQNSASGMCCIQGRSDRWVGWSAYPHPAGELIRTVPLCSKPLVWDLELKEDFRVLLYWIWEEPPPAGQRQTDKTGSV